MYGIGDADTTIGNGALNCMFHDAATMADPIARRELVMSATDGTTGSVFVEIGVPFPSGRDWVCPWRIRGLGDDQVRGMFGVDSLQALPRGLNVHRLDEREPGHLGAVLFGERADEDATP
jgi:hypothetical protein